MKLKTAIEQYISFRKSMGETFKSNSYLLWQFYNYLDSDMGVSDITEHTTSTFLRSGAESITAKWFTRHTALNGFFNWCRARGYIEKIPLTMDKPKTPPRILPYIYSNQELKSLFKAAMTYQKRPSIIYPECVKAILQLTYVLGLRISETMKLQIKHIDMPNQCTTILESKFYTSRIVTFNHEVKTMLDRFFEWRKNRDMPFDEDASLWITRDNKPMKLSCVNDIFKRVRNVAGISRNDNPIYQPRIHDLRHTFAVNRIRAWYRDGDDVQSLLPVLSKYLGHKQVSYTSVYLTMTDGLLGDASRLFFEYANKNTNQNE
ncbi:MAG: tyrosine-type recombinase/integrase [Muribaculum sp.]|nr:tyrosine-type recombinase/integrase [Muribaculum sp.]